jgi:hypothetical protein
MAPPAPGRFNLFTDTNRGGGDTNPGEGFGGFFEAGTETQSPHNNPVVFSLFTGLEHYLQRGEITSIGN